MALSKAFIKAVNGKDKKSIRGTICRMLNTDPSGAEFMEALVYARDRVSGLIDGSHVGEFKPSIEWNAAYLGQQIAEAQFNFSEKRIKHLLEVAAKVHGVVATPPPLPPLPPKVEHIKSSTGESNGPILPPPPVQQRAVSTRKMLGTGATVVGAAVCITGLAASSTALAITGVVCAAAGIVVVVTE
jgi:hypothetical protein